MQRTFVHLPDANHTINLATIAYVIHDFLAADHSLVDRVVFNHDGFTTVVSHRDRRLLRQALALLDTLDPEDAENSAEAARRINGAQSVLDAALSGSPGQKIAGYDTAMRHMLCALSALNGYATEKVQP